MPSTKINVAALYAALDAKREDQAKSWRDVAHHLEISASTFSRMSNGARPDVDSFMTMLAWLGMDATAFADRSDSATPEAEPPAVISSYLRSSNLVSADQADALDAIVQAAYRSIVRD